MKTIFKLIKKGDYETFGFKKPNDNSWLILKWLSYANTKTEGIKEKISLEREKFYPMSDSFKRSTDPKGLFETYKSKLVTALREYFEIYDDPIPFDVTTGTYKPKLKITPTKEFRYIEIYDKPKGMLNI